MGEVVTSLNITEPPASFRPRHIFDIPNLLEIGISKITLHTCSEIVFLSKIYTFFAVKGFVNLTTLKSTECTILEIPR